MITDNNALFNTHTVVKYYETTGLFNRPQQCYVSLQWRTWFIHMKIYKTKCWKKEIEDHRLWEFRTTNAVGWAFIGWIAYAVVVVVTNYETCYLNSLKTVWANITKPDYNVEHDILNSWLGMILVGIEYYRRSFWTWNHKISRKKVVTLFFKIWLQYLFLVLRNNLTFSNM